MKARPRLVCPSCAGRHKIEAGLFLLVVVLGLDLLLLLLDYQSSLLSGRWRRGHCCEIGSPALFIG